MYRDGTKPVLGTTPLTPDALITEFLDPAVVTAPTPLLFYRVKGLSPCSFTAGP